MEDQRKKLILYRLLLTGLLAIFAYFLSIGYEPLFEPFTPTLTIDDVVGDGRLGYRLGYAGAVLLVLAQAYLFRLQFLNKAEMLNIHCYLTLVGGLLILIHSGFPFAFRYWNPFTRFYPEMGFYGLVGMQGLAAWLVMILMICGIYGKYLHGRVAAPQAFKRWHKIHSIRSGFLYVSGITHLILAVQLKYIAAG